MLTISHEQMRALGRAARESFEDRMVEEMAARPEARAMDERAVRARVQDRLARAEQAGVREEPLVRRYLNETWDAGPEVAPPAPPDAQTAPDAPRQVRDTRPRARDIASPIQGCPATIQIVLADDAGQPVADERVTIELPDGTRQTAQTDGNGRVHLFGLDPGNCQVSFPDCDVEKQ